MKHPFINILFFAFALSLSSCDDEKLGASIIEIPNPPTSKTDIYIDTAFVEHYNINVKYKWNASESDLSKKLVPPKEELVVPFLSVVTQAWIKPYMIADSKSSEFSFPHIVPQLLFLVGSPGMNDDGTITQGTAESGEKIVLYQINNFNKNNLVSLQRYFHIMHHEFAHIFHQRSMFSTEYQSISVGKYLNTWFDKTNTEARSEGFITNYAMSEYHEDFVEMIAVMLTNSRQDWDAIVNAVPATGRAIIRKKESYVISYFKKTWDIDIYDLQANINAEIQDITGVGRGTTYASEAAEIDYYHHTKDLQCIYCRAKAKVEEPGGEIIEAEKK